LGFIGCVPEAGDDGWELSDQLADWPDPKFKGSAELTKRPKEYIPERRPK